MFLGGQSAGVSGFCFSEKNTKQKNTKHKKKNHLKKRGYPALGGSSAPLRPNRACMFPHTVKQHEKLHTVLSDLEMKL